MLGPGRHARGAAADCTKPGAGTGASSAAPRGRAAGRTAEAAARRRAALRRETAHAACSSLRDAAGAALCRAGAGATRSELVAEVERSASAAAEQG
jgi:hypothetical protein